MKRIITLVSVGLLTAAMVTSLMSFKEIKKNQPKPWSVPAEYKTKKNPVKADAESIEAGKAEYNKSCASCHGKKGLGDGPKAKLIETFPGDFSGEVYQKQTDGEHFYKTKFGRDEMPGYDKKISDEDIWNMVNYMRTFKK